MARHPLREVVYGALDRVVLTAFPEMSRDQVERNRVEDIDPDEPHPRFRLYDGDQAPTDEAGPPEITYLFAWEAEGNVQVEDSAELGPALNEMHARLVEAVAPGEPIVVPLAEGALELWLEESDLRIEMFGAGDTEVPTGVFTAGFSFRVTVNRGEAFVETAD